MSGVVPAHPIDQPGTDELAWSAWARLGALPALDLGGVTSVVVVAAHPDDEVLGAGGLIALLAAAGARVRLVAVTDGEGSHPGHADPAALARRRTAETEAALRALGAARAEVIRLRRPDTGLADAGPGDLAAALTPLVAGFDLCLAHWEHDLHADHEAAGRATQAAARAAGAGAVYRYPVWMWHWAAPADPRVPWDTALRVSLPAPVAAAKRAAIGCFASQTEDRGYGLGPVLAPGLVAHFTRPMEVLLR